MSYLKETVKNTMILKNRIEEQKKFYKNSDKSPCKKCSNYESDCFYAFKSCDADPKTGYSYLASCGSLNKEIGKRYESGQSISVLSSSDSRMDMMGGGFHKVEKYKQEEKIT